MKWSDGVILLQRTSPKDFSEFQYLILSGFNRVSQTVGANLCFNTRAIVSQIPLLVKPEIALTAHPY